MRTPSYLAVLLFVLLLLLATGVQTAPPGEYAGVSSKDLQAVSDARTVDLDERLVWTRSARNTELPLNERLHAAFTAR